MQKQYQVDAATELLTKKMERAFREARKVVVNDYPDVIVNMNRINTEKTVPGINHSVISFTVSSL